jgi:hypothetical protein
MTSADFAVVRVVECERTVVTFAATVVKGVLDDSWGWFTQGAPAMCPSPSDTLTTIPLTGARAVLHYVCSSVSGTTLWSVQRGGAPRRAVFQTELSLLPPRGAVAVFSGDYGLLLGLEYAVGDAFGVVLTSRDGRFWSPPSNTLFEPRRALRGLAGLCTDDDSVFGLFTNGDGVITSITSFDQGQTWYQQSLETPRGCRSGVETLACGCRDSHGASRILLGLSTTGV